MLRLMIFLSLFLAVSNVFADEDNWGYKASDGPAAWGKIGYAVCATGREQSPVNITHFDNDAKNKLVFHNQAAEFTRDRKHDAHNLYAYELDKSKNILNYNGTDYVLQSLHFHTPAEHRINGKLYPFEGHFIYQSNSGKFLVVGVFYKLGHENAALETVLGSPHQKRITFDINQFYPASKAFYTYEGSLTTPPCAEGLTWIVMKQPMAISAAQLHFFKRYIMADNSRPPQPLDNRVIYFTH
jgi:carbonic anhydrase